MSHLNQTTQTAAASPDKVRRAGALPPAGPPPRGVIIDVDGPLLLGSKPIPGAIDAVRAMDALGVRYSLLSNTTRCSAHALAAELRALGFAIDPGRVVTVASLVVEHLNVNFPGARVMFLGDGEPFEAGDGIFLAETDIDVVVTGGNGPSVTFDRVNAALEALRRGASLVAMHRNTTWARPGGLALDIGPLVGGLEAASGTTAQVVGKPSRIAFEVAAGRAGVALGGSIMVGDDIRNDVLAAQQLGLTGVLTLTGKTTLEEVERFAERPDHVVDSVIELPALLTCVGLTA